MLSFEINSAKAVLVHYIKNNISRSESFDILSKISNTNLNSSTSTNLNNYFKEEDLAYDVKKFFKKIFSTLVIEYNNGNFYLKEINNNELLLNKIVELLKKLEISSSINKFCFDSKNSLFKTKSNEIIYKYNAIEFQNVNRDILGIPAAITIYKLNNGKLFYNQYERFSIFDFFKLNESNILVELDLNSIRINIKNNLKTSTIYDLLNLSELKFIEDNIIKKIEKQRLTIK